MAEVTENTTVPLKWIIGLLTAALGLGGTFFYSETRSWTADLRAATKSLASLEAGLAVVGDRQERIQSDVADLKRTASDMVTESDVERLVRDVILRADVLTRDQVDARIKLLAPYVEDRAMLIQRLVELEAWRESQGSD